MQLDTSSLACTYTALILTDEGIPVSADSIKKIVQAAGVEVEPFWPGIFEKLSADVNISDMISNVGSAPAAGAAPVAAAGGAAAAAAAEPEPEPEEEEDMGFSLFD